MYKKHKNKDKRHSKLKKASDSGTKIVP